ncbi:MAG: response regulator transcription factor [Reyranella sp.]|uniref:response regulator transcription factor n=1 Tax=Reyranella sp. TaxID=1929291 RepID=UPI003D13EDFD
MDQILEHGTRDRGQLEVLAEALDGGIVLVDSRGAVVWMDSTMRRRINGELRSFALPLVASGSRALDCLAAPVEVTVNGKRVNLCVLQEADSSKRGDGQDVIAAVEGIMAESASWFTAVLDRLKTIRLPGVSMNGADARLLTDREREVLGLLCEGKSGAHIGGILGLSENTVRNHIASLYRKIGVNRRSGAIIWARERGITGRDSLEIGRLRHSREDTTTTK